MSKLTQKFGQKTNGYANERQISNFGYSSDIGSKVHCVEAQRRASQQKKCQKQRNNRHSNLGTWIILSSFGADTAKRATQQLGT